MQFNLRVQKSEIFEIFNCQISKFKKLDSLIIPKDFCVRQKPLKKFKINFSLLFKTFYRFIKNFECQKLQCVKKFEKKYLENAPEQN